MMGHIQLDLCIWRDHSIEAGDKDCMQLEVRGVGDLPKDLQLYMAVSVALVVVL